MFQNVLMTALTPLCDTNEIHQWQNRPFTHNWPEPKHSKSKGDNFVTRTIKKRNKRNRTSYTTEQLKVLERTFSKTKYINTEHRKELAESLKIGEKCIKVWFQNRRMKEKRESSESSCDSSSECYVELITPPPVNNTTPSEEQYIPNYYIGVQNVETDSYYQPYVENVKGFSELNAYYQNYGTTVNTNPNIHMFTNNEYFRNDQNIYPTYYYPCTEPENTYTDGNQSQYHKEEENWSANAFDLNFL